MFVTLRFNGMMYVINAIHLQRLATFGQHISQTTGVWLNGLLNVRIDF